MWSVGIGCVTIIAILFRYIQSRMRLQKFNVTYANSQSLGTQNDTAGDTPASLNRKPVISKKNIYDRWLVTRFTIAFFILRWVNDRRLPLLPCARSSRFMPLAYH